MEKFTILVACIGALTCAWFMKAKGLIFKEHSEMVKPFTVPKYSTPIISQSFDMPRLFINNGAMYFPKWKKLKYWQPTKKNPKRR